MPEKRKCLPLFFQKSGSTEKMITITQNEADPQSQSCNSWAVVGKPNFELAQVRSAKALGAFF